MKGKIKAGRIFVLAILCSLALCFTVYGNWKNEGGQWHYYDNNGQMVKNDFKKSGDTMFYLDENGNISKNCEKVIGNYLYQFDEQGKFTRSKLGTDGQPEYLEGDYALNHRQQYLNKKANPYNDDQVVQWFNATYAILTKSNSCNIRAYGGTLMLSGVEGEDGASSDAYTKEQNRKMLSSSWGVTDRASADAVLERLLESGGATGSAWDYSRAMSNLGFYYLAGYYTMDEAMNRSLEVAKTIQSTYHSWDEFISSYLAGYNAWAGREAEGRESIYKGLKGSAFNPYAVDWNLELKKTW
ncbi:DUF1266 domain-containing protein [Enterocloster citroniae]|uniref:DUF1266 domain-containing protein n=2 Tax=Bacillati TaxID=1783272 RepID=UPI00189709A5|nr:DUF1266 domain-containing protein [Enterocloster citroniae]MCB7063481.1 DUF1266 domain-containing protein [Enterocloster citroniae]